MSRLFTSCCYLKICHRHQICLNSTGVNCHLGYISISHLKKLQRHLGHTNLEKSGFQAQIKIPIFLLSENGCVLIVGKKQRPKIDNPIVISLSENMSLFLLYQTTQTRRQPENQPNKAFHLLIKHLSLSQSFLHSCCSAVRQIKEQRIMTHSPITLRQQHAT